MNDYLAMTIFIYLSFGTIIGIFTCIHLVESLPDDRKDYTNLDLLKILGFLLLHFGTFLVIVLTSIFAYIYINTIDRFWNYLYFNDGIKKSRLYRFVHKKPFQ